MSAEHTPEPWLRFDAACQQIKGDRCVRLHAADYERARACVNALAGMDPAAVGDVVECMRYFLSPEAVIRSFGFGTTRQMLDQARICREHVTRARAALDALKGGGV